ncbi:helix-turn-helix transcriptional regulator [Pseudomonas syringae]|nr:helix-turn-helix transcriptional regulator [Pseudomonas syringae]MBD8572978.1 helix-turn-helix transcriptional regulator [Pseudomonas syringae]MBD8790752.1 helix-turn-helix transcriptional regulator [Pseudomonas syringae]MBD8798990.1 helix-turn-helix transcriptional regulator [Pseudomonas syringae]MBD8809817.1 helix-turn-helix transcriptional regulator [Pseudomonas syringae]
MTIDEQLYTPLAARLRRGEVLSVDCPSRHVLKHMTSRWGVLVLVVLIDGTHRFSDLRRKIGGISEKMLAQTLQGLEGDGLVQRFSHPVVPPHVEYSLTPLGSEAAAKVEAMVDWIEDRLPAILQIRREKADSALNQTT